MFVCRYFWMKLTFKSVDFEWSRFPSVTWMGLNQSVESLNRAKDWHLPRKKKFCQQTAFRLELQCCFFRGSPACWPTLQIWDLLAFITGLANSLKLISIEISIYLSSTDINTDIDIDIKILILFVLFSCTIWLIQSLKKILCLFLF